MDKLSVQERSENMRRIKSKDMKPELLVRSLVHRMGYRFRLHRRDLPGKPDIVLGPRRKIIFVHGCFWHSHERTDCSDARIPKSNLAYWTAKLQRNKERDAAHIAALTGQGWDVLVIWECELGNIAILKRRLRTFLGQLTCRSVSK